MAIRPDFTVLQFNNYGDYIRSFMSIDDIRYLQNQRATKELVKLGYRSTNRIYDETEFYKVKSKTEDMLNPTIKSVVECRQFLRGNDPGLVALAEREEPNMLQTLSVRSLELTTNKIFDSIFLTYFNCRPLSLLWHARRAASIFRDILIIPPACVAFIWIYVARPIGSASSMVPRSCDQSPQT